MSNQTYNPQDPSDQTEQMAQAQDQTGNLGGGSDFNGIGENGSTDLGNNTTISGGSGLGGDMSGSAAGATGAAAGADLQQQSGTNSDSHSDANNSEPTGGKWGLSHEQPEHQRSDDDSRSAVGGSWDSNQQSGQQSGQQSSDRTGQQGIDDDSVQFDSDMGDGTRSTSDRSSY
jgi:hypothetical protein